MVHALGIGYFAVVVALGYAQLFARGARPHPTYRRTLIGLVLLASPAVLLDAFGDRAGISALTADRRAEFLWPWTVWTVAATLAFWFAAIIGRKLAARPIDEAWRRASATRTQDRRKLCALAIFAGVTEEFFMRGYFLALLVTVTGSALAALSSVTLVFGLLHHYRGGLGVAQAMAAGTVFGISVLATGTLLPAIAAHVGVNLASATWSVAILRRWKLAASEAA